MRFEEGMLSRSEVSRILLTGSKPSVSILTYGFNIISLKMSDINGLDTKMLNLFNSTQHWIEYVL